jgi:hypothetical protein
LCVRQSHWTSYTDARALRNAGQRLAVLIFGLLSGPRKHSLCAGTALCWNKCSDASVKYQVHLCKNFSRSLQNCDGNVSSQLHKEVSSPQLRVGRSAVEKVCSGRAYNRVFSMSYQVEQVCGRERSRDSQHAWFFACWVAKREPACEILSGAKDLT